MFMPKVRSNSGARWGRKASAAGQDYTDGVQSPRRDWQASTLAATASQAAGVQAAITRGAFAKGVSKSGTARWQSQAIKLGSSRFAQGVTEGVGSYEQGVAPFLQVIESITLPARAPKGDPRNLERVKIIAAALRAKKIGTAQT
jgi:hypothetical protein